MKLENGKIADYETFLEQVREYTKTLVLDSPDPQEDVTFKIVGVEFRLFMEEEGKYTESIVKQAMTEAGDLGQDENSRWLHKYDLKNAQRKLCCLVNEGVRASRIIDLDCLMEIYGLLSIPCYIDYETNTFHLNSVEKKKTLNGLGNLV